MGFKEHNDFLFNIHQLGEFAYNPWKTESEEDVLSRKQDYDGRLNSLQSDIMLYLRDCKDEIYNDDCAVELVCMISRGITDFLKYASSNYRVRVRMKEEEGGVDETYDELEYLTRMKNESRGYAVAAWEAFQQVYPGLIHSKAYLTKEEAIQDGEEHPYRYRCRCGAIFWSDVHSKYTKAHEVAHCPVCGGGREWFYQYPETKDKEES